MSNLRNGSCRVTYIFPMLIGFMSYVVFKKWPCHPVEFKGQGPHFARGVFLHERDVFFCNDVFFKMYLPLALEVCSRLFIDSLGVMGVDENTCEGSLSQLLT